MLPIWIGLGVFSFLPFVALGAAIRPVWVPLALALGGSAIWIYGLGVGGFLAAAIGATPGVLVGSSLRRRLVARRLHLDAQRAAASSDVEPSPGGTT